MNWAIPESSGHQDLLGFTMSHMRHSALVASAAESQLPEAVSAPVFAVCFAVIGFAIYGVLLLVTKR